MIRTPWLTICLSVLLISAAGAQMTVRFDPENNLLLPEIGAIAGVDEGTNAVTFGTVLPKEVRPEEYRDLDVQQGDTVLMMNGERIRDVASMRALYDELPAGGEVKLGLKRGEERFLVKFAKLDPEVLAAGGPGTVISHGGGRTTTRMIRTGDGGDVELVPELHALVGERDGGLQVVTVIATSDLQEGDAVTALNGRSVDSLDAFRELYEAVKIGDGLRFTVRRDGETVAVSTIKAERPQGMVIRREQ